MTRFISVLAFMVLMVGVLSAVLHWRAHRAGGRSKEGAG